MTEETFLRILQKDYYKVAAPTFGKTLIAIGVPKFGISDEEYTHTAVYLGTSKNGVQYVWSKNGLGQKPFIETLDANKARWKGNTVLGMYNN